MGPSKYNIPGRSQMRGAGIQDERVHYVLDESLGDSAVIPCSHATAGTQDLFIDVRVGSSFLFFSL